MKKNSKDFFQSIKDYPHNIGIYLTYTLDNEVIDKLSEVATGTKLILHDFRQGKTLEDNLGSTLVYIPMKTMKPNEQNCFHSKFAFLKSETGTKFIVGSANLSANSFGSHEPNIALELELSFDNEADVFIYNQILNFFEQLKSQLLIPNTIWEHTLEKLRFKELQKKESHIHFVFNSQGKSIFDEYKNYLAKYKGGKKAKRLKIATPFVSEEYSKMEDVKNFANEISIYLRKGTKIKPFEKHQFKIFQPANKKRQGFHSKLLLAEFNSDAVLFIGSANFTEQGFFKKLNESANQECGIILNVSLQEMQEWFNESSWKQLSESEIENYVEAEDNSLEFFKSQGCHYAWAEKVNSKTITYIFNPNNLQVRKIRGGRKLNLIKMNDVFLFQTSELQTQNDKVVFYIGEEKISVSVFELNEYISGLNEKGESIFDWFKGIYSVNPIELDNAIDKQKLSVAEKTGIKITEPPKLEQYFYNVKCLLQSIKHKKYFSDFNDTEIKAEINKIDDGRTLYLTLQLLKIFSAKQNTEGLKQECLKRIGDLSDKLNIDKKNLNTFIKGWLTSKI